MKRSGFSLVELLVVIAIIAILVAVLLPAVQAARGAARRAQCKNNLRQIAQGFLIHENAHQHLPTGGWGNLWMSHPDRGFGKKQPGGWGYTILPFIEQGALHGLGHNAGPKKQLETNARLHVTPVGIYYCPSRREPRAYRVMTEIWFIKQPFFSAAVERGGRSDYAANGGERPVYRPGPSSFEQGDGDDFRWPNIRARNGIIANRSKFRLQQIVDGSSNTYLIGEKYLFQGEYQSATSRGDDQSCYTGDERDMVRFGVVVPIRDRSEDLGEIAGERTDYARFGSAHASSFHMALCDGSIQSVGYQVAPKIHLRMSNRRDSE